MKRLLIPKYLLFVSILTLVLPSVLFSGIVPLQTISFRVEPLNRPVYSGDISLLYSITAKDKTCREGHLSIRTWGGLVLKSESEVDIEFDSTGNSTVILEVYIPEMDTTGIIADFDGCSERWPIRFSYVTSDDTLKFVNTDMRYCKPIKSYTPEQQDSISEANATYGLDIRTLGKDIPPEGIASGRKRTKEEVKRSNRRIKELKPLMDKEYEMIQIADTFFYRNRGETKFQYVLGIPTESLGVYHQKHLDSLEANPPTFEIEFILDLRKPEDYALACETVNELVPTDSAGFYRVKDQYYKIKELFNNGIQGKKIGSWPNENRTQSTPRQHKDTTSKTSVDTES